MEGIGRQRRGFARVVVLLEGLTGRRSERTWYVETGRVVLLRRKHFRYAEGLPLPDTRIYLAEFAAEHVLNVSDALRRTCKLQSRIDLELKLCNLEMKSVVH